MRNKLFVKRILMFVLIMFFSLLIMSFSTVSNAVDENDNIVIVLDPGHGGKDPGAVNSSKRA